MFTRRGFIGVSTAAVGSLALRPFGLLPAMAQSASNYRALVCVFLFGGNDSNNRSEDLLESAPPRSGLWRCGRSDYCPRWRKAPPITARWYACSCSAATIPTTDQRIYWSQHRRGRVFGAAAVRITARDGAKRLQLPRAGMRVPVRRQQFQQPIRGFIGVSTAAVGSLALRPFGLLPAMAQSASNYRALVCVFLFGGNNSNN